MSGAPTSGDALPAVDPGASCSFPREADLLEGVPACTRYLSVDELEASTDRQLRELAGVRSWVCGRDASGREVRCLEAGEGERRVLLLGHVHGEEPVGTLLIEYLLPLFAATDVSRRLGFRLAAIKVCDPEAARLNEGWIGRPYDVLTHVLQSYRSAYAEQPVWSFPVEYKRYRFDAPPPETKAMMAAIDAAPLDVVMGLHDCSFYGGYFYVSDADDALMEELDAVRGAAGIPAHRGEPEVPYLERLGDGIFGALTVAAEYEYFERYGVDPAVALSAGCDSDEYAMRRWGSHAVLAEAPCFTSDQVADTSPAGLSRAAAKLAGIAVEEGHMVWLQARVDRAAHLLGPTVASPWGRAVDGYLSDAAHGLPIEKAQARSRPGFSSEATVGQCFDSLYNRELLSLCRIGQFARHLDAGAAFDPRVAALREEAEARVGERVAAVTAAAGIRPVPIRARVQMQLGALFAALAYSRERRPLRQG